MSPRPASAGSAHEPSSARGAPGRPGRRSSTRTIATPVGPGRVTIFRPALPPAFRPTRPRPARGDAGGERGAAATGGERGAVATSGERGAVATPRGTLVLGHGAGGSGPSRDLLALVDLTAQGWVVALVDQPWRVAGRRVAGPPAQLDAAWIATWPALVGPPGAARGRGRLPAPHIAGGRSAGARVVARTAAQLAPDALLLLSFPLDPPSGRPSREPELRSALQTGIPALLVQGATDSFARPERLEDVSGHPVVAARGGHGFAGDAADVRAAVGRWLDELYPASSATASSATASSGTPSG